MTSSETKTKKTTYYVHQFRLTDNQSKNLISAIQSKEPIVIKFTKDSYKQGTINLPLTATDAKKVIAKIPFNYELND